MDFNLDWETPLSLQIIVDSNSSGSSRVSSADSVNEVTAGSFLDLSQDVIKVILESKKDIRKNLQLSILVQDHFDNNHQTLYNAVICRVAVIRRLALECLQEQVENAKNVEVGDGEWKFNRTLHKMKGFTEAADPFKDKYIQAFESVRIQHLLVLERLRRQRQELKAKLMSVISWRKMFSVIFISAVAATLICSVVAAAMAAPLVSAALAAVTSVPLGSLGKWFDSLWKGYENAVKMQLDLVKVMKSQTVLVKNDIEKIKVLIDKMKTQIVSLVFTAEFSVEDVKNKFELFMRIVEDLKEQVDRCSRHTHKARTVVLRELINPPTGN